MKLNKWKMILSSVLILLPTAFGLAVWKWLPEKTVIHWGFDGKPDGWGSPMVIVFLLPLLLLLFHYLGIWITARDNKHNRQNGKVLGMMYWIMPVISIFTSGITYALAFDVKLNLNSLMLVFLGLLFVLIGNYMPKCKQNRTMGIKVKWSLANEENWNMTHRFAGKVWFFGGILCMLCAFIPLGAFIYVLLPLVLVMVVAPTVYSYLYYKKQIQKGSAQKEDFVYKTNKTAKIITLILVPLILAVCLVILFTGNIKYRYDTESFTIEASFYTDLTVRYADIDSIEYCENLDLGTRQFGVGTPRLSLGTFENEDFGRYTRYTYTNCDVCVVLTVNGKTLVISRTDAAQTKAVYEELLLRIERYQNESN